MRRILAPEMMDAPDVPRQELDRALGFIRLVNRRLGGASALLHHLDEWSARWPRDRPITLLDIATGSADLPIAAARWARRRGFDLRVTGIDIHATTLALAQEHVDAHPDVSGSITLRGADALRLMDDFPPRSFDYVHAGLFLHHLGFEQALTALRIVDRLARAGIIWNDLNRSRVAYGAVHALTIGRPRIVRHDARASVRAGFTRAEALDMARRLDLHYCRYRLDGLAQRFTLAGERPGAWS